ncbi:MAG: hypothetical protein ABSH08_15375 [Tepidisphaeraceae bacterium]
MLPLILISAARASPSLAGGQEIRKVTVGWGDDVRLGRWTPVFVTVEDPQAREVDLQIHGSYGEKSEALWLHQTAVAEPRPDTYALLFPINAQLSRMEVIVSDLQTGRTLGTQALQNNASFSPAGRVPMRVLAPEDLLIGISGDIDDCLRLQGQLDRAGILAGVLDPMKLPANFAGYDGVSVLILAAADLAELTGVQDQAIVEWVRRGGNLVVIPGTTPLPTKSSLMDALPCTIGVNRTIKLPIGAPAVEAKPSTTRPASLNGRELSPRPQATSLMVLDQTGYVARVGLGKIAVLPVDVSPLEFADAAGANAFWKSLLGPMVKVPTVKEPTEIEVSDTEEEVLAPGPNAAESVGRGQRESAAIRHVLELLGATGTAGRIDWRATLIGMAGIFFLLGPVDSVILMRLGQPPRNRLTLLGWMGLIAAVAAYAMARPIHSLPTAATFRLVDQADDSIVAATDVIAVNADEPQRVRLSLDVNEWWEPANQAAREFGSNRFVDANCRQDKTGCRPEWVRLDGTEAQAWHGEAADLGPALLNAEFVLRNNNAAKGKPSPGIAHLTGRLSNKSSTMMTDIQIETAAGNFRLAQPLAAGATIDLDEAVSGEPISLAGLPEDVGDVAPERADRIEELVKSGRACVICQMPDALDVKVGPEIERHWQVLRAMTPIKK